MILSRVQVSADNPAVLSALDAIRDRLGLSAEFPAEAEAEALAAIEAVELPAESMLEVPFFTIDPKESMDLDQAMHLESRGSGYLVRYAIADLANFVRPGGAIDLEARRRGQTMYPPRGPIPLHPLSISEGAASLLPDQERGAYVWTFELDSEARVQNTTLRRARVRSRNKLSYQKAQFLIDSGTALDGLHLLREIGEKRLLLERERGGASLGRPDQEAREKAGRFELLRRIPLAVESWNAQISLMAGIEASKIMLEGRIGILRTMPEPDTASIEWFRRRARALGVPWGQEQSYGEFLRQLDPNNPKHLALMHAAASLFRGASYTVFDGELPQDKTQWAVASTYAHATAPLRRLVDRFALVICEALSNGRPVPDWARAALPELPKLMASSDGISGQLDSAVISCIEAAVLSSRIGERFEGTVLSADGDSGEIVLSDLAVTAKCSGKLEVGTVVNAVLKVADIATGEVQFQLDSTADGTDAVPAAKTEPPNER